MVFEKTLTDIVKGIRASKRDTALYISSCIAEIKNEINSTDPHTKSNALQKLTFLQMMGYNMSYASFATIEVMSNARFAFKRIGYLAASQAFTQDTDVVLLTTNTLKKELRGAIGPGMNGVYEAGLAINCLSNIVTEDLARDLLADVTNLIVHPQPYLRKKAILCLLKMFMKYPQGLRLTFSKLQDSLLKDINPSVTSCAVNVITELSDKNPKNYLVLAPSFFALLTTSSNNWMLIKVVKLLGSLVPEEPRLARKLLDPLANIVQNTQAKSLLYEAVYTITLCLPYCQKSDGSMPANLPSIVSLCAQTLKSFIVEQDQNLKYLGLVGFASLIESHPKVLTDADYRGLILACLSDEDVTIRTRALDLLIGVATRKNVMELVTQLLHHVDTASGSYKVDLVVKIIDICSSDKYALLTDFAWYMDVLVILAHTKGIDGKASGMLRDMQNTELGPLISGQITDVTLRVLPVRSYSVRRMIGVLLKDGKYANENSHHNSMGTLGMTTAANMMPEVLSAAAWIIGEYALLIDEAVAMVDESDDDDTYEKDELKKYDSTSVGTYHAIIQALTDSSNIDSATAATQSIYVQAAMKVFAAATSSKACTDLEIEACVARLGMYLPVFMHSMDAEVQERAFTAYQLLNSFGLVLNPDTPPVMTLITEDEGDESDASEDKDVAQDDLLNLVMSTPNNSIKPKPRKAASKPKMGIDFSSSMAQKSRNVSDTLKYIYIPEQMKPISAKAQRKKLQSAPAMIQEALDEPVNFSVFSSLLEGDRMSEVDGKRSIEAVSFTQQKLMRVTKIEPRKLHLNNMQGFGSNSVMPTIPDATPATQAKPAASSTSTINHPFYLNTNQDNNNNSNDANNRFGTIQLLDDGQDSDEGNTKKKKKGKRRKKKTSSKDTDQPATAASLPAIMIDSDDDDDDDDEPLAAMFHGKMKAPSKSHFEGFDTLAQIDLTTPLREDETMPTMVHRVVPERRMEESEQEVESVPKKKKKAKKGKTSKKTKEESVPKTADVVQAQSLDLLDFSGLSMPAPASNEPNGVNPITSAFDDLLALDLPPAEPEQNLSLTPQVTATTKQKKSRSSTKTSKVWQEATIKISKATGSNATLNWEDLKILYRIKPDGGSQAFVTFKVLNTGSQSLHDVAINLKDGNHNVTLENVEPEGSVESRKVGPIQLDLNGFNTEIKGSFAIAGCTAPIKISIATCTFSLVPMNGLTQESVGGLLSSGDWSSSSAKIQCSGTLSSEKTKNILKSFLQAEEVDTGSDGLNGIFACQHSNGSKVLSLLKTSGENTIKIDVKSTDKDLGKAISSAMKRVML